MIDQFRPGEAVYFHNLHADRLRPDFVEGPDDDGEYRFHIEGKARRMLVIRCMPRIRLESAKNTWQPSGRNKCTWYEAKGRPGYWVLSLQTTRPPEPHLPYGGLLESNVTSYIVLRPIYYPVECVAHRPNQTVQSVGCKALQQIIKHVAVEAMGYSTKWERE